MKKLIIIFAALIGWTNIVAQDDSYQNKLNGVEQYLDTLIKEWNIPGIAIGIVHKDTLLFARGFGYRDLDKKLPVNSKTIFPIASNTKLFTSIAAGMLQESGKLKLDDPVRNYLPELVFSNDELNGKATLRDMLSHRTGLPRYDGIWVNTPFSRKELVGKVVYMKPNQGFRDGYQYNNMMYAAAGLAMEKASGMEWEDLTRQMIFKPLGMNSSGFTNAEAQKAGNFALSYFTPAGSKEILVRNFEAQSYALGPAGTIKSNVEDMSKWMVALLNNGKYKGQQIIPLNAIKQTLVPKSIGATDLPYEELSHPVYGLGRQMLMYKGIQVVAHTGSIDDFYSNLIFLPHQNLAIFMVNNYSEAGGMRSTMALPIIDRLLNLPLTDWNARWKKEYQENLSRGLARRDSLAATQLPNTAPSHPLTDFTGTYSNPMYGDMTIELTNGQLQFSFRSQHSVLHHFHYDQFTTKEERGDVPNFRLLFMTNAMGEIDRFSCSPYGDPVAEFVKRK